MESRRRGTHAAGGLVGEGGGAGESKDNGRVDCARAALAVRGGEVLGTRLGNEFATAVYVTVTTIQVVGTADDVGVNSKCRQAVQVVPSRVAGSPGSRHQVRTVAMPNQL
jgi:hypothetical protein